MYHFDSYRLQNDSFEGNFGGCWTFFLKKVLVFLFVSHFYFLYLHRRNKRLSLRQY